MSTKVYEFCGFTLTDGKGKNATGPCPFCGDESHFSVNKSNGQHQCFKCKAKGNVYTFLEHFHSMLLSSTTKKHYSALAELRGLPAEAFLAHRFAYDPSTNSWWVPVLNEKGKLANLKRWWNSDGKLMSCPGLALHLYNRENIQAEGPIFIVESEWNVPALEILLERAHLSGSVVATMGAANFKKEWIDLFKDRVVFLCYDNDNAGSEGARRAAELLKETASEINTIEWSPSLPEGYDIRDYFIDNRRRLKSAGEELMTLFNEEEVEHVPSLTRTTLASVIKDFKTSIEVTKKMEDFIALMFATIFSVRIPGDPIWLFVVGPPGAGKTLILRSTELNKNCIYRSNLTPHSLVSGFRAEDGKDPSLIPQVKNKCLIIKDYTEVKSLPITVQEEIYGVLRGAYDGRVEKTFGNGVYREYPDCHFSLLAGVTNVIHSDDRATLGERFLKYTLIERDDPRENALRAAINNTVSQRIAEVELHESSHAFVYHLWQLPTDSLPGLPTWAVDRLVALAQVIAFLRASVDRKNGELQYRPEPEVGTRLAKQIAKLLQCLAVVLGSKEVGKEEWRIAEQVAFETATGWFQDLIFALSKTEIGLTVSELTEAAVVSPTTTRVKIDDLVQLGAVTRIRKETEGRGRPEYIYRLSTKFKKLWEAARLDTYTQTNRAKKHYRRRKAGASA